MAVPDTGIYSWVRDSIGPLADGKIPSSPTWKLYMIQDGVYTPSFGADEDFAAVIDSGWIVATQTVAPGLMSNGEALIPDTDFPFLTGPDVGGLLLTVSGSIERMYAHWGRANGNALPFAPAGLTKRMVNLVLRHVSESS